MGWEDIKKRSEDKSESPVEETTFYRSEGTRNGAPMLQLYRMNGRSVAFDYNYIQAIDFPGNIVILISPCFKITISGSNLEELAHKLMAQIIKWVKPHYGTKPPDDGKLFVDNIKIESIDFEKELDKLAD